MKREFSNLLLLCRCLAPEASSPEIARLKRRIASDKVMWEEVVQMVNDHFLTPALTVGLQRKGLMDCIPADLRAYLSEILRLNTERNLRIRRQLEETVRILNAEGIEPLLLKGAAYMAGEVFPDPGGRLMRDLDLMAPSESVEACMRALRLAGYRKLPLGKKMPNDHHHEPPVGRPEDMACVEIHTNLLLHVRGEKLSPEQVFANSRPVEVSGLRCRMLSPTYLLLHNFIHAQILHRGYAKFKFMLRDLHDFSTLCSVFARQVDWRELRSACKSMDALREARAYVLAARALFGTRIPAGLRSGPLEWAHFLACIAKPRRKL